MARGRRRWSAADGEGSSGDSDGRGCCQEATAEDSNGEHGAGEFAERGRGRGSGNGDNGTSADIKRFAKNGRGHEGS